MKIRKEGLPFILISGLISLLLFLTRLRILGLAPVMFVAWFFRDPERVVPAGSDLVLSPADGTIIGIAETKDELVGKCTKVSIFMSVFNVHVNRAPVSGDGCGEALPPRKVPYGESAKRPMPMSE